MRRASSRAVLDARACGLGIRAFPTSCITACLAQALVPHRADLRQLNEFAPRSLDEGLEETFTLTRLGVGSTLRQTPATTNMLESVLSLVEQRTGKSISGQSLQQERAKGDCQRRRAAAS